jgi:hypothetical protein
MYFDCRKLLRHCVKDLRPMSRGSRAGLHSALKSAMANRATIRPNSDAREDAHQQRSRYRPPTPGGCTEGYRRISRKLLDSSLAGSMGVSSPAPRDGQGDDVTDAVFGRVDASVRAA